jgi:hypothetical protein
LGLTGRHGWSALALAAVVLAAPIALAACSGTPEDGTGGEAPSATTDPTGIGPTTTAAASTGGVSPSAPSATTTDVGTSDPTEPEPSSQEEVLGTLPGDASGACVAADGQRDVRSGGIGAGTFTEAADDYADVADGENLVSLHWIPAHADGLTVLTVRGTQITGGSATFVSEQSTVSELVDESGQWRYYFITNFEIPAPGLWRLEATSGEDTGCFTVTFTS